MTVEVTSPSAAFGGNRTLQTRVALAIVAAPVLMVLAISAAGLINLLSPQSVDARQQVAQVSRDLAFEEHALQNPVTEDKSGVLAFRQEGTEQTPELKAAGLPGFKIAVSLDDPISDYVERLSRFPSEVTYKVAERDTLLSIFARYGIDDSDLQSVTTALAKARLRPEGWLRQGQPLSMRFGEFNETLTARPLLKARVKVGPIERIEISRAQDGTYTATKFVPELTRREIYARGTITTSLSSTAKAAGVPPSIVAQLTNIYTYDVDFQRDIHPNDSFELLYSQYVSDDGDVAPGKGEVVFSRLDFKGKSKSYYRHVMADGKSVDYFDQNGRNARKFLMKTPISGARLSSSFGMRRHPVLGYNKMHRGVDFAAPRGTPIYAAGDGVVKRASRYGSYGKYVRIKHANGYTTAYAHMHRYGPGIKSGVRVKQGQIIGYVGTTGRSTGPHLHYEVAKNGRQVNPMSVKVPTGNTLSGKEKARFQAEIGRIEQALATHGEDIKLADARSSDAIAVASNGAIAQ